LNNPLKVILGISQNTYALQLELGDGACDLVIP